MVRDGLGVGLSGTGRNQFAPPAGPFNLSEGVVQGKGKEGA